ncbi:hypothetical protein BaRGS_00005374 [Batillaria attramentaria]|uniref:Uncharacterized protein n=1 Tax=Batillaria attramentaria TaxID=370345 RepID=A0ABD0LVM2_9CAEN
MHNARSSRWHQTVVSNHIFPAKHGVQFTTLSFLYQNPTHHNEEKNMHFNEFKRWCLAVDEGQSNRLKCCWVMLTGYCSRTGKYEVQIYGDNGAEAGCSWKKTVELRAVGDIRLRHSLD